MGKKMKKKIKKLSREQVKKRVFNFCDDMQWVFDYQNFDRGVVFKKENRSEVVADVVTDLAYRRITINIYPYFFEHKPEEQRELLLHEFCHTFTDKLYGKSVSLLNGKLETFDKLKAANEEATSRITQVLNALLQDKLKYAKDGYSKYLKNL